MRMYQIWVNNGDISPKLLAIMPEDVLFKALSLASAARRRLVVETENNGLCSLFSSRGPYFEGFGNRVLVSRFDQTRLGYE